MGHVKQPRQPGWFWVFDDLIDTHGSSIGATGIAVYAALCRFANREGQCFPSVQTLAKRLALSPNTVRRALHKLEEVKLITVLHRVSADGGHQSNLYTLHRLRELPQKVRNGTPIPEPSLPQPVRPKEYTIEGNTTKETSSAPEDAAVLFQSESSHSESDSSLSPKVPQKGISQAHIALIDAWGAALPGGPPVADNLYARYGRIASALAKAGITPAQVADFTRYLAFLPFWEGKLINLEYVAANIRAYLAQKGNGNHAAAATPGGTDAPAETRHRVARPIIYVPRD